MSKLELLKRAQTAEMWLREANDLIKIHKKEADIAYNLGVENAAKVVEAKGSNIYAAAIRALKKGGA